MALPTIERQETRVTWPEQGRWTYDDWLRLPGDEFRYEIVEGELHVSPSPSTGHQFVVTSLIAAMHAYARKHELGAILTAPVGVRLPEQDTAVQPDILFVARDRLNIIRDDIIDGAPDLVVEVLSPSNWIYDRTRKQKAYERAGVREYWIVDYRARTVDVLALEGGEFVQRGQYHDGDTVASEVLPGLTIPVADIFFKG
jgi:Uma2 family endonuclease